MKWCGRGRSGSRKGRIHTGWAAQRLAPFSFYFPALQLSTPPRAVGWLGWDGRRSAVGGRWSAVCSWRTGGGLGARDRELGVSVSVCVRVACSVVLKPVFTWLSGMNGRFGATIHSSGAKGSAPSALSELPFK